MVRNRLCDYSLAELAEQLTVMLQPHVTDKTGLTGKYDFTLEFETPEKGFTLAMAAMLPHLPGQPVMLSKDPPTPAQEDGRDCLLSYREAVWAELEKVKIPLDILGIDHIEKIPTDN